MNLFKWFTLYLASYASFSGANASSSNQRKRPGRDRGTFNPNLFDPCYPINVNAGVMSNANNQYLPIYQSQQNASQCHPIGDMARYYLCSNPKELKCDRLIELVSDTSLSKNNHATRECLIETFKAGQNGGYPNRDMAEKCPISSNSNDEVLVNIEGMITKCRIDKRQQCDPAPKPKPKNNDLTAEKPKIDKLRYQGGIG